jgi:aspartate/methionine/tyrosine aminotransferase
MVEKDSTAEHFARRTDWVPRAQPIKGGVDRVDLTETNPTRCAFSFYDADLVAVLDSRAALEYRPDPRGRPEARAAVAGYYAAQGLEVDPSRIYITASTSEAYGYAFRLLANAGDNVAIPCPGYPLFRFLADLHDVESRPYPLVYTDEWSLDPAGLRAVMDKRTRAILSISPNNPTGSYVKAHEQAALVRLARESGCALISDDVFSDYDLAADSRRACSLAATDDVLTFTLGGISKALGLPQMKLAWLVLNGPPPMIDEAARRLDIIADTFLSASGPAQAALGSWLERRGPVQQEITGRLRANLAALSRLNGSAASALLVEGGWSAILRLPQTLPEAIWVERFLVEARVVTDPGALYGFADEAYVVISLLPPTDIFNEGIARLRAVVDAG